MQWLDARDSDTLMIRHRVVNSVHKERSAYQEIEVIDTVDFGRMLLLDGIIQTSVRDEFIYHEMLAHVPLFVHPNPKRVLIIGGGDGGILRETLRHKSIQKVTMVEIDRSVVDMCLRYMPSIPQKAFDDKRTDLVIADGAKFVAETKDRYDVIIVDSTDPIGPGEVLFTEEFYRNCRRCLTDGGILVNQNGVPFMQPDEVAMTYWRRKKSFKDVGFYLAAVPSYYGGFMTLGWATNNKKLRETTLATLTKRFKAARLKTKYYTPEVHRGAFALPQFIQGYIKQR